MARRRPFTALVVLAGLVATLILTTTGAARAADPVTGQVDTAAGPFGGVVTAVALDGYGNTYLAESGTITRIDAGSGAHRTVASGLGRVDGMQVVAAGDLYALERTGVSTSPNPPARVVKVAAAAALVATPVTVLDNLQIQPPGQSPPEGPSAFAVALNGDIYLGWYYTVYRVPAGTQDVETVAGKQVPAPNNFEDLTAPGATPLTNRLGSVRGIALHPTTGEVYFSDSRGAVLRIHAGVLERWAGGGGQKNRPTTDPPSPVSARDFDLSGPQDLAFGPDGALLVFEDSRNSIIRVAPDATTFVRVIGDEGGAGFYGDGGPAYDAEFHMLSPTGASDISVAASGDVFVADGGNKRVRRATRIVGGGSTGRGLGPGGDANPPTAAFSYLPAAPVAGEPVSFSPTSPDSVSWSWTFGDGTATSSAAAPSHVFANAGSYTVALTATKVGNGKSVVVEKVVTVAPSGAGPADYRGIVPVRMLETREAEGLRGVTSPGPVGPGQSVALDVVDPLGFVDGNATVGAVVLNVTVIAPSADTFVTVYPDGTEAPRASNINVGAGQVLPNLVVAKVGANGRVRLRNHAGNTDLIADLMGWFPAASDYRPLAPARVLETRASEGLVGVGTPGPIGAGPSQAITLDLDGVGGIPATGAGAVVLNVTVAGSTDGGYLTVFPGSLASAPGASNLNYAPGEVTSNLVIAKLDDNGRVKIENAFGTTHVIADVAGWFPKSSALYTGLVPARLLDTRPDSLTGVSTAGPVGAGQKVDLTVLGRGGVPASGVGAVVLNVTAADITAPSYVTVFPSGVARPNASNLNLVPGDIVPNLVVAKVGVDGRVSLYNHGGTAHLIADVVGYLPG
ncbi:MAG: PKD domain-containing protein [Acidimicrobiia bacterium]|nr:PKD domain-containing protein [Acidimicrobiia bacterium]